MHKIGQSGGFLGRLLGLLLKTGLSLIKIVLKPLAKSLLVSLRLTVATSAKNGAILESGIKPLIMLNYEMNNVMKIVKSLAEFGPLIKGVSETIKIEKKRWVYQNVIRYIRCYFIRKSINRERKNKSRWKFN